MSAVKRAKKNYGNSNKYKVEIHTEVAASVAHNISLRAHVFALLALPLDLEVSTRPTPNRRKKSLGTG